MRTEQAEIGDQHFSEKCPICGKKMAEGNLFCSIQCYKEFKKK